MAPVDNLLKKQLAQIKARALMIAGRASAEDVAAGSVSATASPASNDIIESVIRTGAVTRGRDFARAAQERAEHRSRRFPWWFRRRMVREERRGFEGEFQRILSELATGDPVPIEHAVPGVAGAAEGIPFYLIRSEGSTLDPIAEDEARRFAEFRNWPTEIVRTRVGPAPVSGIDTDGTQRSMSTPDPRNVLFLDIETAGLSANTYAFLIGLMYWEDGRFVSDQIFARDYAEEEGMLRHVRATMERFDTVVTYNGASFDLPFIRQRMTVLRVPDVAPIESVDLLHAARRVFKPLLPNCRLVTVEKHLRGVERVDDIPSRFIPRAYHEFVHSRDARLMRNVVYHNRMDVFTMAVILNRLCEIPFAAAAAGATIPGPNPPHVPF